MPMQQRQGRMFASLLLAGCVPAGPSIAHRGGEALGPKNSETALRASLEAGVSAIELDVFLTGDRVPVLAADAWLDEETCETLGGRPLPERVWLAEQTADVLMASYRCGVVPSSDFPDAPVDPAPILDLERALLEIVPDEAEGGPELWLNLVHIENVSLPPEAYAAELDARWRRAGRSEGLRVVSDRKEVLTAVAARSRDLRPELVLRWPRVPPKAGRGLWEVGTALSLDLGTSDPVGAAEEAGASGLWVPAGLLDISAQRAVSAAGLDLLIGPWDDLRSAGRSNSGTAHRPVVSDPSGESREAE
jgi:hypothetical protein